MPTYYPTCRVRVVARFDEMGEPAVRPLDLQDVKAGTGSSSDRGGKPVALTPNGADPLVHTFDVLQVHEAIVENNGVRIADTATVKINFADFPFDPRMIRYAGIVIFMGGNAPDEFLRPLEATREHAKFFGKVDDVEALFDDGEIVTLACRDLTATFIDTPAPKNVELTGSLETVIRRILKAPNAPWEGIGLEIRGLQQAPQITQELRDHFTRQQLGADGNTPSMPQPGGGGGGTAISTWDYITRLCFLLGVHPMMDLDDSDKPVLVIGPARVLIAGRTQTRQFVYGRNLKKISLKRKLGNLKAPTIAVTSYNPSTKQSFKAAWPDEADDPQRVTAADAQKQRREVKTFPITGLKNEAACRNVAKNIFEQIARQEIGGGLETDDMTSFADPELDSTAAAKHASDLRRTGNLSVVAIRAGDPLEIRIAESNRTGAGPRRSAYGDLLELSQTELARALQAKGYPERVATIVARYLKGGLLEPLYTVRTARHRFSKDDGYSFSCEVANFIQIRDEAFIVKKDPTQQLPPKQGTTEQTGSLTTRTVGSGARVGLPPRPVTTPHPFRR